MVINSPCLNSNELAIPEQTVTDKESTNPLMADSLPKTIMPTKLVKPQGFNLRPNRHGLKDVVVVCIIWAADFKSVDNQWGVSGGHLQSSSPETKESQRQEALN
ncbi:hypothetical protein Tco_1216281 [Tanacetum coccineum]